MIYEYKCDCENVISKNCTMGKAPGYVKCKCGKRANRSYSLIVSVPESTHISREGRGKG